MKEKKTKVMLLDKKKVQKNKELKRKNLEKASKITYLSRMCTKV